jgi:polyhydroxyalkanoate synthesis regulator phasin
MLSESELREKAQAVVSRIDDTGALPWPEAEELVEEALRSVQDDALKAAIEAMLDVGYHQNDLAAIRALRRKP